MQKNQAISSINADPIKQLINPHWHFDHTEGNEWVHQAGASILAHDRKCRAILDSVEENLYGARKAIAQQPTAHSIRPATAPQRYAYTLGSVD